jgi:hypothetical protein
VTEAARAKILEEVEVHHYQTMGVVTVEPRRLQDLLGRVARSFGMQLDGIPSASAKPFSRNYEFTKQR